MNTVLWIAQGLLAIIFLMSGSMKAFTYEQAKKNLPWVKDASKNLVTFIGASQILGAIGLILPMATNILPWLTPIAAAALALVMLLAAIFHFGRKEMSAIGLNIVLLALCAFVAVGRG